MLAKLVHTCDIMKQQHHTVLALQHLHLSDIMYKYDAAVHMQHVFAQKQLICLFIN